MNWTTIMVGLDDLKAKINRFYSKKIVIGTIQGEVFMCSLGSNKGSNFVRVFMKILKY